VTEEQRSDLLPRNRARDPHVSRNGANDELIDPLVGCGRRVSANVNPEDTHHHTAIADVFVSCEGSVFLFTPLTPAAEQWISEHVQADAKWFGSALVVEWIYAAGLAAAMREEGLILA